MVVGGKKVLLIAIIGVESVVLIGKLWWTGAKVGLIGRKCGWIRSKSRCIGEICEIEVVDIAWRLKT